MTRRKLEQELRKLGLRNGDVVLLHSALSSLGGLDGGAKALVEGFLNVLGKDGTLVVPSFCEGIVPEMMKKDPRAVESVAPFAQVAAIGARAKEICAGHWKCVTAHAEGTPYMKIADMDGYVCLLGVDQDRSTTLHAAEELLRLPYLQETEAREIKTPDGKIKKSFRYYPGPHRAFIALDKLLGPKMRTIVIGDAVTRLIKSRDLIDMAVSEGRRNPAFVLCDNPACGDCVRQRSMLLAARWRTEKFTLVASAALAGRYVPEMIENCRAAGIENIELDCVQGKPVHIVSREELSKYAEELRAAELNIASLRSGVVPADFSALADKAKACGANRVVVPLTSEAEMAASAAAKKKIEVVFYNLGVNSKTASSILVGLDKAGLECGFAFHAANFAKAGEKPFLESFRTKSRHFLRQLEVSDALFDGSDTPLERGNAEIKEMISILRCKSFSGRFVLGEGLRAAMTLPEAARYLLGMIDNM